MMKILITAILLLTSSTFCYSQNKKILIVATNVDVVGKNESGTYLYEIAYPFQYFIDHGYDVDITTPKGGKVAIYPKEYAGPGLGKIQRSELFISKTKNSLLPTEVKDTAYAAVFYPGGHGQYFDVINDERISNLTAKIYENGGVIGSAGHGAVSLVNIKLSNHKYLVEGKKMTCFPHWAELQYMFISDYGKLLPFDMEEVLASRGANLIACEKGAKQSKGVTTIVDDNNRIVTGAFAGDAQSVAEEIVKLLQTK